MMPEIMSDMDGVTAAVLPPVDGPSRAEPGEACPLAPQSPAVPSPAELAVARQLVSSARERGAELTGPDGLLGALTKTVIEAALDEEMTEHLGYDKHDVAGRNSGPVMGRCVSSSGFGPDPVRWTRGYAA